MDYIVDFYMANIARDKPKYWLYNDVVDKYRVW
ncbi:hypothetical protein VPHD480_0306 [Vibrio phage D480]